MRVVAVEKGHIEAQFTPSVPDRQEPNIENE
jgi:hypothetical protein